MTTSERTKDRGLVLVVILSLVVAVCMVALTIAGVAQTIRTTDDTTSIRLGNDIAACRAQYRLAVDDADASVSAAQADLLVVATKVQRADLTGDVGTAAAAAASLPSAQEEVAAALAKLTLAVETYAAALDLSQNDPAAFLASCSPG